MTANTPEHRRLEQARTGEIPWKSWGPYLSERQWGTVREDYSAGGDAWSYFTHDQARSRAYRWGEDGIAGISDDRQRLCLALALWNGADPILKERMFGLTNSEGNHGEDVKEYWFYVDSTPTHSYLKCQYKYPQRAFPYWDLVSTNAQRNKQEMEYELLDTGIFDEDRYFDVIVEYAKANHDDILMLITAYNRGPESATLHLLPTLWFRNTWSWGDGIPKPEIAALDDGSARAAHHELGEWRFCVDESAQLLFCENETNNQRLFGAPNATPYVKDGVNDFVVAGRSDAVNPERKGTKMAAQHVLELAPGESTTVRLRLVGPGAPQNGQRGKPLRASFDHVLSGPPSRGRSVLRDADPVYAQARRGDGDASGPGGAPVGKAVLRIQRAPLAPRARRQPLGSQRHDCSGAQRLLVSHDLGRCDLNARQVGVPMVCRVGPGIPLRAAIAGRRRLRQGPDRAAVEDALHAPQRSDPGLRMELQRRQPARDRVGGAVRLRARGGDPGKGDHEFLARVFSRLLTNFAWWVNRKDADDRNLFQGGFLGLDNIGIFDRSAPLPGGGTLEQADGTAWMALYSQWLLQMAIELAKHDRAYLDMALKFISHFAWISVAMNPPGGENSLYDEDEGFYYDAMRMPDGTEIKLKVRSLVGLMPVCAATVFDRDVADSYPEMTQTLQQFIGLFSDALPGLSNLPGPSPEGRRILSLVDEPRLRRILAAMLDEEEFLGAHGIRAISRRHLAQPVRFEWDGQEYDVHYLPAESDTGMFGGNSNWRGPVWFPMNMVILRGLMQLHRYYGDRLKVECPTGSGNEMNLLDVAAEIATRLATTFTEDENGRRPVFGGIEKFQTDPHWHDLLLFHEYFHGDNGAGIGASHQTGWTGTVALLFLIAGARLADPEMAEALGG